ncbi:Lamin Tail Domain [Butyrivibrio sp. Su6]|uniref:CotH kinase family protein n=1 Tax=Butyrivibrio sp. Su6 TaxID=1520810 RepID=UPI00089E8DD7|nr:CotH kinase family protein [Butyrivibrio sp. Su6]SEG46563.1 Lamin Tail Domain [Butyrivibrio sp. Su6]
MKRNKQLICIGVVLLSILAICLVKKLAIEDEEKSPIVISEVCPHNVTAAYDDNGDYGADYIELYNRSDSSVNLKGWSLSDSGENLRKFIFPDFIVEPGQCIIAWCSDNTDDISLYRDDYVPVDVHGLSFHISDGEECILTDPEGQVVSSAVIASGFSDDKVVSLIGDDYYISDPSPYYVEQTPPVEKRNLDAPTYSVEGGWFTDNVVVELSAKEGEIYYTLDGSIPDESSIKYTGAITIENRTDEPNIYSNIGGISSENNYLPDYNVDKGTALKAVAISADGKSDVVCNTYFVGLDESEYEGIGILSVSFDPDDFFGYEKGIYVYGKVYDLLYAKFDMERADIDDVKYTHFGKKGRGWEREVGVEFFTSNHVKIYSQTAGIRVHGGWTREMNQKNFQIYAREEYDGNNSFNYDFFDNGLIFDKLMLRSGGSTDMYVSKIRDVLVHSLVNDREIGTQRSVPYAVFLNGEYWGLYNLQETIGTSYIEEYYGVPQNNVVIIKNGESRTNDANDVSLYDDVVTFATENDMSIVDNYREFEKKVDIQSLIDYYAIETYVANSDTYKNNYAVWRSRDPGLTEYEDCRWRWLLFDLDDSCAMNIGANTADIDSFVTGNWYDNNPLNGDELFTALCANQEFRERFADSFTEIATNNFDYETVSAKLWAMADRYKAATIKSNNRFRGDFALDDYPGFEGYEAPYDEEDYQKDIEILDAFFRDRAGYIINYMYEDLGITN